MLLCLMWFKCHTINISSIYFPWYCIYYIKELVIDRRWERAWVFEWDRFARFQRKCQKNYISSSLTSCRMIIKIKEMSNEGKSRSVHISCLLHDDSNRSNIPIDMISPLNATSYILITSYFTFYQYIFIYRAYILSTI